MMRRFRICIWVVGLSLFVVFLAACESRDKYAGTYRSEAGSAKQGVLILELRANGDGLWKVGSDEAKDKAVEVPFAWYVKRGELRINTRAGGVIVGKIENDTIQVTLPGAGALTFRRVQ